MKKLISKDTTRVDKFLSKSTNGFSRNEIVNFIKLKKVLVNSKIISDKNFIVKKDDIIELNNWEKSADDCIPWNHNIDILYEDNSLIVVNKETNLPVHPGIKTGNKTLLNAVLWYLYKKKENAFLVNRIDKDTTGIVIFAKNRKSLELTQDQFKNRTVKKTYLAIVDGIMEQDKIEIIAPIAKSKNNPMRQKIGGPLSKIAKTTVFHLETSKKNNISLIKCIPITGRTHQIRVHLKYIKYPIYNDSKYGKKGTNFGQFLHAWKVFFLHPEKKKNVEFVAPIPTEFKELFSKINKYE